MRRVGRDAGAARCFARRYEPALPSAPRAARAALRDRAPRKLIPSLRRCKEAARQPRGPPGAAPPRRGTWEGIGKLAQVPRPSCREPLLLCRGRLRGRRGSAPRVRARGGRRAGSPQSAARVRVCGQVGLGAGADGAVRCADRPALLSGEQSGARNAGAGGWAARGGPGGTRGAVVPKGGGRTQPAQQRVALTGGVLLCVVPLPCPVLLVCEERRCHS